MDRILKGKRLIAGKFKEARTISSVFTISSFLGKDRCISAISSSRLERIETGHKGAHLWFTKGTRKTSFFFSSKRWKKSGILELSFRQQSLLDCSGQVELLCSLLRFPPVSLHPRELRDPLCPFLSLSLGENGGRSRMYRADKRKWPRKEEWFPLRFAPAGDVCFENCSRGESRLWTDRGKK